MAVIIGRDEGMVQPIEQRDVAIDLIKPAPVTMTNLLNLTHTTCEARNVVQKVLLTAGKPAS